MLQIQVRSPGMKNKLNKWAFQQQVQFAKQQSMRNIITFTYDFNLSSFVHKL